MQDSVRCAWKLLSRVDNDDLREDLVVFLREALQEDDAYRIVGGTVSVIFDLLGELKDQSVAGVIFDLCNQFGDHSALCN